MNGRIVSWTRLSRRSKNHLEAQPGLAWCGCAIPPYAKEVIDPTDRDDLDRECRACINARLRSKGMMTRKERLERTADRRVAEFLGEEWR